MKKRFGTNSLGGLNVGTAPHLIESSELTISENGWTEKVGSWMSAPGPTRKYSGYSDITAFVAARILGADHLVWYDDSDNGIYDNGILVDTLDLGENAKAYAANDGVIFYGNSSSSRNYIYDGNVVRELGAFQPFDSNYSPVGIVNEKSALATISSATTDDPVVITPSTDTGLSDGDAIVITGHTPNTLNGTWTVDNVDASSPYTFEINCDGTLLDAGGSGGSIYSASGLVGDYRYYATCIVTLSDGSVLESRPVAFRNGENAPPTQSGDVFTLTADDAVTMYLGFDWEESGVQNFYITGTIGTDYVPGIRLYRTKAGGTDFYLEKQWDYADPPTMDDATISVGGFLWAEMAFPYTSIVSDKNLGAVYVPSLTAHTNPASAAVLTTAGQRMFYVPYGATNEVHWTELDGIEYSDPLNYVKIPDVVTALYGFRDRVVIWSADRMWVLDLTAGITDLKEIITPVGTTYDQAIARTDMGVLFLRADGLWLFDGARVQCVSRRAFDSISSPQSVCAAADTVYISGLYDSYVARIRDNGWTWHEGDSQYIFADDTSGVIYGASRYNVDELFTGDYRGGKMRTKLWTMDSEEWIGSKVWLEVEENSGFDLWIEGGRSSDTLQHYEPADPGSVTRRLVEISIPRLPNNNFYVNIESGGYLVVHGIYPEVTK